MPDVDAYCNYLFEDGGLDDELVHVINAVSTNKTDFFREPAHFDYMRDHALPEIAATGRRQIKLWSAAASIGAEAYTLAMVLEEFRRAHQGPDYSILATDICTDVLEAAHAGRYPVAMIEPVPMELRRKYVLRSKDPRSDQVRIAPQLRSKLTVARLNLMDETYPVGRDMDFVFCRNILIYFDKATQEAVLARLCSHIRPGGYLILGHSESAIGPDLPIAQVVNTIFRRV
jgi:chemotaxis protein methyltransferase CheR